MAVPADYVDSAKQKKDLVLSRSQFRSLAKSLHNDMCNRP